MRVMALVIFGLVASGFADAVARAALPPKDLVRATLLADVKTAKPGQRFKLGVLLKIKPGWHIYWINPGDAGLSTRVKFAVPDGFKVGELQFPVPVEFDQGGVIGYGYRDEVMLTASVTSPANLEIGEAVHVSADVSWLCCEKVCVPGKAKVSLDLTASQDAEPDHAELFEKWSSQIPRSAADAKDVVKNFGSIGSNQMFVEWTKPVREVQWFGVPPESSGIQGAPAQADGKKSTFTFALVPPPKRAADVKFVIAYTDQNGNRRGVEFISNITPSGN